MTTEVFEIVDRLTYRRAKEVVWLSAADALDALAKWGDNQTTRKFQVRSVRVASTSQDNNSQIGNDNG